MITKLRRLEQVQLSIDTLGMHTGSHEGFQGRSPNFVKREKRELPKRRSMVLAGIKDVAPEPAGRTCPQTQLNKCSRSTTFILRNASLVISRPGCDCVSKSSRIRRQSQDPDSALRYPSKPEYSTRVHACHSYLRPRTGHTSTAAQRQPNRVPRSA